MLEQPTFADDMLLNEVHLAPNVVQHDVIQGNICAEDAASRTATQAEYNFDKAVSSFSASPSAQEALMSYHSMCPGRQMRDRD